MAKVIAIGQPVNDSERQAIAHLRDHLPDTYTILHNFEIQCGNELFEVDAAVVAPHAVYLVDVKGTRGNIDVYGGKWYPERRQPFNSPLPKLRGHAKTLSGLIADHNHADPNLRRVYCDAAVMLTAPDAHLSDQTGKDAPHTTTLAKCVRFFQDASQIPDRFLPNIARYTAAVIKVIQGSAKPVTRPPQYGDWIVSEKLGGTDLFTEYRAYNALAGEHGGSVLLRVYPIDPYAAEDERQKQRRRIENAYRALSRLPSHSAVQAAKGFFATEDDDRYILVVEDTAGQALRLHIEKPALALTFDQKLRIARDLLAGLAHAHRHEVVHRNICPSTILYGADGQTRLINFDHARSGTERTSTIGGQIVDELEAEYQAPECFKDPSAATAASDMFSVGVVLYELFTGERPFSGPSEVFDQSGMFAVKPSQHQPDLPEGFDGWLQNLCAFDAAKRPSAAGCLVRLEELLKPKPETSEGEASDRAVSAGAEDLRPAQPQADAAQKPDYLNLPAGYELTRKYVVQERLGKPGGFGVVYKVIDTLGDVSRAVKLILQDRSSTVERLRQEYRPLLRLPEHRYVVRVVDADFLPGDGTPYLVFEFVHGTDVGQLIETRSLTRSDAWELGKQVLEGLIHLHANTVYHCDIKPRNLLWTDHGVKILDFNVAVMAAEGITQGGGTRRYLPPDYDLAMEASAADLADRDLFATGITLFEAMTWRYPWDAAVPPPGTAARDPRDWTPTSDLAPAVVDLLLKSVAPRRADRFQAPEEMLRAMQTVKQLRIVALDESEGTLSWQVPGAVAGPNHNPFVDFLLTRYSQGRNNQGTRGLDTLGGEVYVDTALDRELTPATLSGEFRLVVITGNAGDGKTAFLEKLQRHAEERGAVITPAARGNGAVFGLDGRQFLSNYDGSQDEGDVANEAVLHEFLGPFQGIDSALWPRHETRLIAINEGRLIDFLQQNAGTFPLLMEIAKRGLDTGVPEDGVALVNLNLRSVVAPGPDGQPSLLERLIGRLTQPKFWNRCEACDLRERCYVLHNVKTFQDETAGPLVTQRLQALYTLTSLRGRLHITLRDLGSAMAFTLAGTRNCEEIHDLYAAGRPREIVESFYFNSWMGGSGQSADRLLALLRDVDIGIGTDPRLDRGLDFQPPERSRGLLEFEHRGTYDAEILMRLYSDLPWDHSGRPSADRLNAHQAYVATARRRHFFERRDEGWRTMLRYRSAERMLELTSGKVDPTTVLPGMLRAINLGEGLTNPELGRGRLSLQVREVPGGTIRSYRTFPGDRFKLVVQDEAQRARFVEHMPTKLVLRYRGENDTEATLDINLDVFEMFDRLNHGYRPTGEELQGYYLSLAIFKNILGSAPYQEVLLTPSGHDFFRVRRQDGGTLKLEHVGAEV